MATLVRRLYDAVPPPARTGEEDRPTLLVCWWCTGFALTIIVFRLAGRYIRAERLFREDKVMALSIIPLLLRMGLVHVILIWGTNNAVTEGLSPIDIQHREIGSRLVLASRIMYAAFLWTQKFSITEFFKRLISQFWKRAHRIALQALRWFLLGTFLLVVIATLSECQPFDHYWQVVPDPGPKCRQGYAQLLTMGTVDVITDFLLVGFPVPVILRSHMTMKRKFQLVFLFSLSLIPTVVTIYRVPSIIDRQGSQQFRSLWASVEILFATAVANALVLGSFVRDRGPKKMRFRFGSTSDSLSRPSTRRQVSNQHWGSDEDLVRGLGLGLDPELRATETQKVRRAPMADPAQTPVRSRRPPPLSSSGWQFPPKIPEMREHADDTEQQPAVSPDEISVLTPRRVSFFDVGGLLEEGMSPPVSASTSTTAPGEASHNGRRSSVQSHDFATAPPQNSRAFLEDIGGLLGQRDTRQHPSYPPPSFRSESLDIRLSSIPSNEIARPDPAHHRPSTSSHAPSSAGDSDKGPQLRDIGHLLS
ncbi:MAG: hypothetical protein M4579_000806 [Chaenotheca gracillima]|nr:MAG: hypothetical protein M4579_000806 [Chaenotheca gracillima]